MATKLTATWRYGGETDFDASFEAVGRTLLEVFAAHESASVQHSIWIVGRAIIDRHPEVAEVTMTLPNLHHWLADLSPFGQPNDREIFIATTEPHGLIQATVRRGDVAGARAIARRTPNCSEYRTPRQLTSVAAPSSDSGVRIRRIGRTER